MLKAHRAADRNMYWFDFAAKNNLAVTVIHEPPNGVRIELIDASRERCEWTEDIDSGYVTKYHTACTFGMFLDRIKSIQHTNHTGTLN